MFKLTPVEHDPFEQPTAYDGNLHVVSTVNPETDRTKIHGVFANAKDALKTHEIEVKRQYAKFRDYGWGDGDKQTAPMWAALQQLAMHDQPVPSIDTMRVGGLQAPKEVSLVHEIAVHDNGHKEARLHAADENQFEAEAKAAQIAQAFYENGNQEFNDDDQPLPFPGLKKANRFQDNSENISQGIGRSGIFRVTRHSVIA